jgi:hypothetical protein
VTPFNVCWLVGSAWLGGAGVLRVGLNAGCSLPACGLSFVLLICRHG